MPAEGPKGRLEGRETHFENDARARRFAVVNDHRPDSGFVIVGIPGSDARDLEIPVRHRTSRREQGRRIVDIFQGQSGAGAKEAGTRYIESRQNASQQQEANQNEVFRLNRERRRLRPGPLALLGLGDPGGWGDRIGDVRLRCYRRGPGCGPGLGPRHRAFQLGVFGDPGATAGTDGVSHPQLSAALRAINTKHARPLPSAL